MVACNLRVEAKAKNVDSFVALVCLVDDDLISEGAIIAAAIAKLESTDIVCSPGIC